MSRWAHAVVASARHARGAWVATPELTADVVTTLLGVGSASTSLVDYPKTGSVTTGDWYVDPTAVTNGAGTSGDPFDNLTSALEAVSNGETILVRAGTLSLSATIYRNIAWDTGINVYNYGTERPILDFQTNPSTGNSAKGIAFGSDASGEHWKGFEIINTQDVAVDLSGTNLTIEDVWAHDCYTDVTTNVGRGVIRSFRTGSNNHLVQDCSVWRCGDGSSTGTNTHDCYQVTAATGNVNTGTAFVRCFGAHGGDDVFDLFRGADCIIVDCVAFEGGYYWNGTSAGDGSGFKLGGNSAGVGNNTVRGGIAVGCRSEAIKPNSSPVACSILGCTVVDTVGVGINFANALTAGAHTGTNNISLGNNPDVYSSDGTYSIERFNTWNTSAKAGGNADFPVTNAQFVAVASFDWSLASGSPCIGAADDGGNLGASSVALEIAKEWLAKDLTS